MKTKIVILLLALAIVGLYLPSGLLAQEKIKIGIVRFSDEAGYPEGEKGIIEQLKKEGFDETKVSFDIRNAEGKKDKVTEIAKEFLGKKMDLIFAIGTTAVIKVYEEVKDIPIVCAIVFDPVGAGVAKSWQSSGTNVTGTSSYVPMESIVQVLSQVSPVKNIGVLYNREEKNSVLQLEDLKALQDKLGFKVISGNVSKVEEVGDVTNALLGKVDSIFISGSTVVGQSLTQIMEITNKAKIPTIAHLPDRAKKGVLIAVSSNPVKLGELAGRKAAAVLRGVKPTDIPFEKPRTYDIIINLKTAKALGINIPVTLLRAAAEVIE